MTFPDFSCPEREKSEVIFIQIEQLLKDFINNFCEEEKRSLKKSHCEKQKRFLKKSEVILLQYIYKCI